MFICAFIPLGTASILIQSSFRLKSNVENQSGNKN